MRKISMFLQVFIESFVAGIAWSLLAVFCASFIFVLPLYLAFKFHAAFILLMLINAIIICAANDAFKKWE